MRNGIRLTGRVICMAGLCCLMISAITVTAKAEGASEERWEALWESFKSGTYRDNFGYQPGFGGLEEAEVLEKIQAFLDDNTNITITGVLHDPFEIWETLSNMEPISQPIVAPYSGWSGTSLQMAGSGSVTLTGNNLDTGNLVILGGNLPTVPEPGTLSLAGGAGLMLILRRRRVCR